jgi:hypothetical protein
MQTDNDKLLEDDINTRKESGATLIDATDGVGVEVSTERINICGCLLTRIQDKIIL